MGDCGDGAGESILAYAPDVQVIDVCVACLDRVHDVVDDRMVHFPVQQHFASLDDEAFCPDCDQYRPNDACGRVKPVPSAQPSARQRDDGQHRGERVCEDVDVGRLHVEVLVVFVMVAVVVCVVVPGAVEDHRADKIDGQSEHGHQHGFLVMDGLRRDDPFH